MGYKHKDERLDQIGRDLSVQYVLENSLRESGDHMRLTAQLIQVKDQSHLWSHDYDYPAKDVLNVEDDVAKAVAHEIRTPFDIATAGRIGAVRTRSIRKPLMPTCRGTIYFERDSKKDTDMAAKYFERATQLDPGPMPWLGPGLSRVRQLAGQTWISMPAGRGSPACAMKPWSEP